MRCTNCALISFVLNANAEIIAFSQGASFLSFSGPTRCHRDHRRSEIVFHLVPYSYHKTIAMHFSITFVAVGVL